LLNKKREPFMPGLIFSHTISQTLREEQEKVQQEEKIIEMRKRSHPTTNSDFARLYNELDQWRRAEVAKIKVCFHSLFT
jgi:hypothetical protein